MPSRSYYDTVSMYLLYKDDVIVISEIAFSLSSSGNEFTHNY